MYAAWLIEILLYGALGLTNAKEIVLKRILVLAALAGFSVMAQAEMRIELGLQPAWLYMDAKNQTVSTTFGNANYKNLVDTRLVGFNPYIGLFFNDYFGIEVDYLKTQTQGKTSTDLGVDLKTETDFTSYSLGIVPRMPIGENDRFAFLSILGIGNYKVQNVTREEDGTETDLGKFNDLSSIGYTMGVGGQYQFTEYVGLRAMVRYVKASLDNSAQSLLISSIGLNFRY